MTSEQSAGSRKQRVLLAYLCAIVMASALPWAAAFGEQLRDNAVKDAANDILSRDSVLRDPDIPSLGNPKGGLTIVEYFDYQCPYCKKTVPELAQLAREDGDIRIVAKDWPVFGALSVAAAKLALAAKYQNKYAAAHDALIAADAKLTETNIDDIVARAGVDVTKAKADLQANQKSIDDLLARNGAQAEAFGFQGTPGFIVGTFRIPGALEMNVFKQVIADARAAAKKRKS